MEVGDQSSKKAVVGSFFLSRFNSNCLAATRLAEIAMELEEHDRESVSRDDIQWCREIHGIDVRVLWDFGGLK